MNKKYKYVLDLKGKYRIDPSYEVDGFPGEGTFLLSGTNIFYFTTKKARTDFLNKIRDDHGMIEWKFRERTINKEIKQ